MVVLRVEARGCVDPRAQESVLIVPVSPEQSGNVMH